MKKINICRKLIIIISLIFTILLFGCEDNSIQTDKITSIMIESPTEDITVGEFTYDMVNVVINYRLSKTKKIVLSKEMLSEEDQGKLLTIGHHSIEVNYKGYQAIFSIDIIRKEEVNTLNLSIVEINDLHGYIEQDDNNYNGLANTAYIVDQIRNETKFDDTVLIGNGDLFQGTAISNLTEGKAVIDAMNEMDFDAMGIGNHEFDWGLPTILQYFDGDESNGEANFPLLNANIYDVSTDSIVTIEGGNIFTSTIVEKEGLKVGIVSFIGDVSSSINYAKYQYYYIDTDISAIATSIGRNLKDQGADIVIANIHGGNAKSVNNYDYNNDLAKIIYQGDYVFDAIINGHTHTAQIGYISRTNAINVPVVQAGGYNSCVGRIDLAINMKTKSIKETNSSYIYVDTVKNKYNETVQSVINTYADQMGNEIYAIAGETVNYTNQLRTWAGNVLRVGIGADIGIANNGGLRSNGNIENGKEIGIKNIYEISPFNNDIYLITLTGDEIYKFIEDNSVYYSLDEKITYYNLQGSSETYQIAVIDYVYFWDSFPKNDTAQITNLKYTDLMIIDIKLHDIFSPITEPDAKIDNQLK